MTDIEKLTTLKACLKQHRLKTYELVYRRHLATGLVQKDPGQVYDQIKSKHLLFSETAEEKQIRVLEEGDALEKGKLSAFQWEVRWESHLADRDGIGLGLNKTDPVFAKNWAQPLQGCPARQKVPAGWERRKCLPGRRDLGRGPRSGEGD